MKKQFRNRLRRNGSSAEDAMGDKGKRFPFGWLWLVFTVIVLIVVLMYDRRAIHTAQEHIAQARNLESTGLYLDALTEYESAFENKRLGRKAKAGAAVAMAEIYYNYLEDFPQAHKYYVLARQIAPSSVEDKIVQEHAKQAQVKAQHSGVFTARRKADTPGVTTRTIVQNVELLKPPTADERGPVLVTYKGGEIRTGELYRALAKRPEFLRPDFREDPEKLKNFLEGLVRDELIYQAAVSAGVHKDVDVSARLYDYQKTLVTQRYRTDRQAQAMVVDNAEVEKYYKENVGEYVQPGTVNISIIQSDSEKSAADYLKLLKDGALFEDVATSHSQHKESAVKGGALGTITEKDTTLPGVGEVPDLIDSLFKLPVHSVTEVTPVAGKFYIFKITGFRPSRNVTLDEARPQIENILRGRFVDQARTGLEDELRKNFEPEIDQKNLQAFWDFAQAEAAGDAQSTGSAHSKSAGTTGTTTINAESTATSGK